MLSILCWSWWASPAAEPDDESQWGAVQEEPALPSAPEISTGLAGPRGGFHWTVNSNLHAHGLVFLCCFKVSEGNFSCYYLTLHLEQLLGSRVISFVIFLADAVFLLLFLLGLVFMKMSAQACMWNTAHSLRFFCCFCPGKCKCVLLIPPFTEGGEHWSLVVSWGEILKGTCSGPEDKQQQLVSSSHRINWAEHTKVLETWAARQMLLLCFHILFPP